MIDLCPRHLWLKSVTLSTNNKDRPLMDSISLLWRPVWKKSSGNMAYTTVNSQWVTWTTFAFLYELWVFKWCSYFWGFHMVYLDSIYPSPFLPDPPHPLSIHSNTCTVFLPSFAPLFPSSPLCGGWLSQSWSLVLECGQGTRCHAVEGNKLRLVQQQSNADSSSARGGSVPTSSSPRWDAVWLGFVDLGHAVGTVVRLYVHLVYCVWRILFLKLSVIA